jgi:hypothetical protein
MPELRAATLLLALLLPASAFATAAQEWRFRVLLDDREIGSHRYKLTERDGEREVESDARFTVRFLFVDAYRYVHRARERWRGDCLAAIDAETDDNGRQHKVRGTHDGRRLEVETKEARASLPGCVMSFAYWNTTRCAWRHWVKNPSSCAIRNCSRDATRCTRTDFASTSGTPPATAGCSSNHEPAAASGCAT